MPPRMRHLVWSKNSCGFTLVVFQEPPEPFATLHRAYTRLILADSRKEQHVAPLLVGMFFMIMGDIRYERMPQGGFPT